MSNIEIVKHGSIIHLTPAILDHMNEPIHMIWTNVLCQIFHNMSMSMISHQSASTYIEWLKTRNNMIVVTNGCMSFMSDNMIYIIKPSCWSRITATIMESDYDIVNTKMSYDSLVRGIPYIYKIYAANRDEISRLAPGCRFAKEDPNRKLFSNIEYRRDDIPIYIVREFIRRPDMNIYVVTITS